MTMQTAKTTAQTAKKRTLSPRRGSTLPPKIQDHLTQLAGSTLSVAAINKEVLATYGYDQPDEDGNLLPQGLSERTVAGFVKQVREDMEKAGRESWTLIDDDTGEPAIVLETLAE